MDAIQQTKIDGAVAVGLMTAPFWHLALQDISLIASTVAAVCGAMIGIKVLCRTYNLCDRGQPE